MEWALWLSLTSKGRSSFPTHFMVGTRKVDCCPSTCFPYQRGMAHQRAFANKTGEFAGGSSNSLALLGCPNYKKGPTPCHKSHGRQRFGSNPVAGARSSFLSQRLWILLSGPTVSFKDLVHEKRA